MRVFSPPLLEVDVSPLSSDGLPLLLAALAETTSSQSSLSLRLDRTGNVALLGGPVPDLIHAAIARVALEQEIELEVGEALPAWRERLLGPARADCSHKRQSHGAGEFARVILAVTPTALDSGDTFSSHVSDASIPLQFVPAVEAGVINGALVVERFPVIGFQAELLGGAYHDVDSTAVAFESAAREAFRRACANAGTQTIEPVAAIEILAPIRQAESLMDALRLIGGDWTLLEPGAAIIVGEAPASNLLVCLAAIDRFGGVAKVAFSHYLSSPTPEDDYFNSPNGARRVVANGGHEPADDWATLRHRQTLEGLADVDAGKVFDHEVVRAWMGRINSPPLPRASLRD